MSPSSIPVPCESPWNLVNSPYSNLQLSLIFLLIKYSYLAQSWIKHYRTFSQLILLALRWNVGTCACADPSTPGKQHACVQARRPVSKWWCWLHRSDCCDDSERHRVMIRDRRKPRDRTAQYFFLWVLSSCGSAGMFKLAYNSGVTMAWRGPIFRLNWGHRQIVFAQFDARQRSLVARITLFIVLQIDNSYGRVYTIQLQCIWRKPAHPPSESALFDARCLVWVQCSRQSSWYSFPCTPVPSGNAVPRRLVLTSLSLPRTSGSP